jgi:hypothetical protein
MRNLIRKILKENTEERTYNIEVGDIYKIPTNPRVLVMISDYDCRGDKSIKTNHSVEWGYVKYYHDGCYVKYKISYDDGQTWSYESGSDGHWVEVGWINLLVEKDWWILVHKREDFFDKLNESEDLEWAEDAIKAPLISVGDVFYIVDNGAGSNPKPLDYKPEDTRYVFYIDNIVTGKDNEQYVTTTLCDPKNTTYNKSDYGEDTARCYGYSDPNDDNDPITYRWVIELIETLYWRRME